ncbi:tail fiber domain-containing protein, partial [bacterium]|nr:tail fiber domain-containing protein [bacterium]
TAWEVLSDSTKKTNRRAVNTQEILTKVAQLPIEEWNFKHQDSRNTHIGPMAQDFYRLFGYGDDDKSISTIDPDGIALAAIQELHKENQQLKKELNELRSLVEKMVSNQTNNQIKTASATLRRTD